MHALHSATIINGEPSVEMRYQDFGGRLCVETV